MNSGHFHINSVLPMHPDRPNGFVEPTNPHHLYVIRAVKEALPELTIYEPQAFRMESRTGWKSQATFIWASNYTKFDISRRLKIAFDDHPDFDFIPSSLRVSKKDVTPQEACEYLVGSFYYGKPRFEAWLQETKALCH